MQHGVAVHTYLVSSTGEAEAGRSWWVQGQPGLRCELQASRGYIVRSCLKVKNVSASLFCCHWPTPFSSLSLSPVPWVRPLTVDTELPSLGSWKLLRTFPFICFSLFMVLVAGASLEPLILQYLAPQCKNCRNTPAAWVIPHSTFPQNSGCFRVFSSNFTVVVDTGVSALFPELYFQPGEWSLP